MKSAKVKKEISIFLVFALFITILTGCSDISTIRIQEDGSGSYEENFTVSRQLWDMTFAGIGNDEMLKGSLEKAYPGSTASIEDTVVNGVESKNIKLSVDFTGIEGLQNLLNAMGMYSMQYNGKYFSRSVIASPGGGDDKMNAISDNLGSILSEDEELAALLAKELENMEVKMTITFPYTVTDTDGTVQEDGKTVVWDAKQQSDKGSTSRLFAIFAEQDSKKAPKFEGVKSGKNYNTAVTVKVRSENLLDYVKMDGEKYESDYLSISEEGTYELVAVDKNKNKSSIKFRIDTTKPQVKGVKNGKTYNKAVVLKFSDKGSGIKKSTLNGKKLGNGTKVSKKGSYTLKVTDYAGNSKTVKFKIA